MDDLRAIGAWLAHEGRGLLLRLREPQLWAALLSALLLWSLAYQAAPPFVLHVGGDPQTHKRDYDLPFLADDSFNDSEPGRAEWWSEPPYRWTKDNGVVLLPGAGGGRWTVRVLAASGPRGGPVESLWRIGDDPPIALTIEPHPRVYTLIGGATNGDLRITMQTSAFAAPGDSRTLGLVVYRLAAAPTGRDGLRSPALGQLGLLALLLGVCYCLARRLALRRGWSLWLAVGLAGITAYMLAAHRLALTPWTPALAALAAACYLLALLLEPALAAAARALCIAAGPGERGAALAATIGAFALRMAGLLHPYAKFSDLGFNVHNLDEVIRGDLFLYAGLPAEVGGGQAPYPPAQYLALAPLRLLLADQHLLIQAGNALVESCAAALIWLLLRRAGQGRRAALLGAALYITIPPLLRSYSVGEFANIFGQSLLAPLLLFLVLGAPAARRWPIAILGALLLLAILLSHTGVAISTTALLLAWLPLWWFGRPPAHTSASRTREPGSGISSSTGKAGLKAPVWRLLAAGIAAGLLALALFYSGYAGLIEQRRALAAATAAAVPDPAGAPPAPGRTFGAKVLGELRAGFTLAKGISPLLASAGALGLARLWRRQPARLDLALLACWLGMLLSLATLLRTDQAVRWQAFLYPALCLGAAPVFAACWRRGRAGTALALLALAYLAWAGVEMWARQVVNYLH